jgi:hypothetical protein
VKDWVDLERKNLLFKNAKSALRLSNEKEQSLGQAVLEKQLTRPDFEILPQNELDYALPAYTERLVSSEVATELTGILLDVQAINNELAGFKTSHATVVLAEDPRYEALASRLRDWVNCYADHRAERTKHLENTAIKRFQKLYGELYPDLMKLFFKEGTVNGLLLHEFSFHLPWSIMKRACSDHLDFKLDPDTLKTSFTTLDTDDGDHVYLCQFILLYHWTTEPHLSFVLGQVAAGLSDDEFTEPEVELRERLKDLVSDIQEMRPFLLRNWKAENLPLKISDGIFINWDWDTGPGAGIIGVAADEKTLIGAAHNSKSPIILPLLYDGRIANGLLTWMDTDTVLTTNKNALRATARIVTALHHALFAIYEKVDTEAILTKYKLKAKTEKDSDPSDEEFAALYQSIAIVDQNRSPEQQAEAMADYLSLTEEGTNDELESVTTTLGMSKLQALRLSSFLRILQKNLGCDVRKGKGSELVIFREGGHCFRLGHHKNNPMVPTHLIKNILKHIGIGFDEWLNAAISVVK